jgi:hypothetical protein
MVLRFPADQWEEFMKTNYKMTVATLAGIAFSALAMMVSGIATALAQDTVRVRGTIERIDGSIYVIKARDNQHPPGDMAALVNAKNPREGRA